MITDSIISFLNEQTEKVGLPTVMLDMVATGESIALQTVSMPTVQKSYINGSALKRYSFRLTRKGMANVKSAVSSLNIIKSLDALALLFTGMNSFLISDEILVESAEASTTSILVREDNGLVVYGVTIDMLYKENNHA